MPRIDLSRIFVTKWPYKSFPANYPGGDQMTSVAMALAEWAAGLEPGPGDLALADCVGDLDTDPSEWTWENVPGVLRRFLPGGIAG
jgi:hypothetical protein